MKTKFKVGACFSYKSRYTFFNVEFATITNIVGSKIHYQVLKGTDQLKRSKTRCFDQGSIMGKNCKIIKTQAVEVLYGRK